MAPTSSRPNRSKSRQSIAHFASAKEWEADKENATTDLNFLQQQKSGSSEGGKRKKNLRSKSLGPGGLEALKQTAAKVTKTPSPVRIKSILKPAVPWTPPKAIPAFDESRKRSVTRGSRKSPRHDAGEELLIDFSTPAPSHTVPTVTGTEYVQDPFSPMKNLAGSNVVPTRVATQAEEEATIKGQEAEQARKAQKHAALEQRAARRKSMANRRVSFAPEATLHTWNVVELIEDSTTSSTSNSTRRQSSATVAQNPSRAEQNHVPNTDHSDLPSTPPKQIESPLVKASPAQQPDLHQRDYRRRSSGVPQGPLDQNDSSPASIYSGSSGGEDSSLLQVEDSIHSSSDEDGDTAMSMDEVTGQTVQSVLSGSSTGSSLDERLRRAAAEAGTRGMAYDESGEDLSMEFAEGTITNAFQPWVNGQSRPPAPIANASAMLDQENVNPFSPAFKRQADARTRLASAATGQEAEDMTMEMTVAGGGLLQQKPKEVVVYPDLEDQETENTMMDMTMDMTMAGGGLLEQNSGNLPVADKVAQPDTQYQEPEDVTMDVTMDMTVAAGGVIKQRAEGVSLDLAVSDGGNPDPEPEDEAMDMTVAGGSIMPQEESPVLRRPKTSLHDFLDMTNIHFIELSAAKRRHTRASSIPNYSLSVSSTSAAACVAAVTTLPLLELYQHATRELKSYILTGREVIQSIEQETSEEEPALFREYVEARSDVRMVMDNQFRNGKANARLQSKEGWYEWRGKLVEGLRSGLVDVKAGLETDATMLTQHEKMLQDTVPILIDHLNNLEQEAKTLQQRAEESESIDHEALNDARGQLGAIDHDVKEKTTILENLQKQVAEKVDAVSSACELKTEFEGQIAEAERVLDECRGWKVEDVRQLEQQVRELEAQSGWSVISAEQGNAEGNLDFGPALTMKYGSLLRLFFYPCAFQHKAGQGAKRHSRRSTSDSAPLSLTYCPAESQVVPTTNLTTQQRFFLQLLQGHLHSLATLPKGSVSAKALLAIVGNGWRLAEKISAEIRLLGIVGITTVSILSDEELGVTCMLMLPDRCRVDIQFVFAVHVPSEAAISSSVAAEALPKYGAVTTLLSGARGSKVREALNKQVKSQVLGEGAWVAAVRGLEDWIHQQTVVKSREQQPVVRMTVPKEPTPPIDSPAPNIFDSPTPAPTMHRKGLKRPVPMEEVMEEAAARQEEVRRQEEGLMLSARKTGASQGRRPGALRRSP